MSQEDNVKFFYFVTLDAVSEISRILFADVEIQQKKFAHRIVYLTLICICPPTIIALEGVPSAYNSIMNTNSFDYKHFKHPHSTPQSAAEIVALNNPNILQIELTLQIHFVCTFAGPHTQKQIRINKNINPTNNPSSSTCIVFIYVYC